MAAAPSLERPPEGETTYLFVYGGLMRGCDLHHYLASAKYAAIGWTRGALVSLGRYPGLVDGEGNVMGELYELAEPAAELEALDDLEDFDPANPAQSTYLRVTRKVQIDGGAAVQAWAYVYNRDVSGLPVIAGGDWRSATAAASDGKDRAR